MLYFRRGFTLVEILLVVMIIGILAALVVPNLAGRGEQARETAARTDVEATLATALDLYEMDNGRYPTTAQGLKALIVKPDQAPLPKNWRGPYLKKRAVPQDPWKQEYVYLSPGKHNKSDYDLSSCGADGVAGEDDIANWENENSGSQDVQTNAATEL
jgi:general secretion pathway protein G